MSGCAACLLVVIRYGYGFRRSSSSSRNLHAWEEGILCFLYRLVNIQTFAGMVHIFGLKESDLCALFGFMLEDFMKIFGHLLQDLSPYAP
jgi:hypothetical protein